MGTGAYVSTVGLPAGTYFVRTANTKLYTNQLYQGIDCDGPACPAITNGTPVLVTEGATTTAIDLVVQPAGKVSGTVTAVGGARLKGITVLVVDASGAVLGSATTDATGVYTTSMLLMAGSYYVRTANSPGYVDRLYGGGDCPAGACDPTAGTSVAVAAGTAASGIDFVLAAEPPVFTDDPLVSGATPVKAVHLTELRQAVALLRARFGLPPTAWTDAVPAPRATAIKAVHITELRAALSEVHGAAGIPAPDFAAPVTGGGQAVVTAAAISELRAAVAAVWQERDRPV